MSKLLKLEALLITAQGLFAQAGLDFDKMAEEGDKDSLKAHIDGLVTQAGNEAVAELFKEVGIEAAEGQSPAEALQAAVANPEAQAFEEVKGQLSSAKASLKSYHDGLHNAGVKIKGDIDEGGSKMIQHAVEAHTSVKAREILASHGMAKLLDEPGSEPDKPGANTQADDSLSPIQRISRSVRIAAN